MFFGRLSKSASRNNVDIRLKELQARLDDRHIVLTLDDAVKIWLADNALTIYLELGLRMALSPSRLRPVCPTGL